MSSNGINATGYAYGNYYAYNNDFLAANLLNHSQANDSIYNSKTRENVNFTGKEGNEKSSSNTKNVLLLTASVTGAFLLGKYWKPIKGFVKNLINGKNNKHVKTVLEKAKSKIQGMTTKNKKHKIKGTSVNGANKPISNTREAEIVQNINKTNANSKSRKLVEQHLDDIVTPEMQAAYNKQIAYQAPTQKQKAAISNLHNKNTAQKAELSSVKNNSKGTEALQEVAQNASKNEAIAKIIKDGPHINPTNKNIYFTKNGQIIQIRTAIPNANGEYVISDPKKIAKHLAKHNIKLEELV